MRMKGLSFKNKSKPRRSINSRESGGLPGACGPRSPAGVRLQPRHPQQSTQSHHCTVPSPPSPGPAHSLKTRSCSLGPGVGPRPCHVLEPKRPCGCRPLRHTHSHVQVPRRALSRLPAEPLRQGYPRVSDGPLTTGPPALGAPLLGINYEGHRPTRVKN